ncbi:MAG TPA: hemolysin family protein [Armatimonadota bacterium]|jgi:CBS domain containing-hemolysin-like protein
MDAFSALAPQCGALLTAQIGTTLQDYASLLAALVLIGLSAFFVTAEYALVKARPTRLDELAASGSFGARIARNASRRLDLYLSATQVGVTIVTLLLGKLGEPAVSHVLSPLLKHLPVSRSADEHIALVLSIALMAALQVVYGEQVPKYMAIQRAERLAILLAPVLHAWYVVMYAPVIVLTAAVRASLRLFGIDPGGEGEAHSPQEIELIVTSSEQRGTVGADEAEMARNAIIIGDRDARDVMVPRVDMAYLTTSLSLADNIRRANIAGFTRFPLCQPDADHVIGMVHIKDLLAVAAKPDATIMDAKRDILVVPETKALDSLLREFQKSRIHMALVLDEYGGTAGIVTLEDVLEEIVGDIQDEHQHEHPDFQPVGEHAYLVDGGVTLDDLDRDLGIVLESEEAETLAGFVQWRLGAVPETGQEVRANGYVLKVEAMEGRRVRSVLITRAQKAHEHAA